MSLREEGFGSDFIYDAKEKKAVLCGRARDGAEMRLELVRRNDDDSHDAVLKVGGQEKKRFGLKEDEVTYSQDRIRLLGPSIEILVDDVSAAKFRGFTKGNIPTPDIPSDSLP